MNSPQSLNFSRWREQARAFLRAGVPPAQVDWDGLAPQSNLFGVSASEIPEGKTPRVPRAFLQLSKGIALHRDPRRWDYLYAVLYRLTHREPKLLEDFSDPDVRRLQLMEKEVRRDLHKMKAFVRFRRVEREGLEEYIAWHRPDHYIVEAIAPWFVRRFGAMRWSILTPDACAFWDLEQLRIGLGATKAEAPEGDTLEDLWRSYYRAVFNPARLKVKAMVKELPVRHWATLPEAELIPSLILEASDREQDMREKQPKSARPYVPESRDLETLAEALPGCRGCELWEDATQGVFGEGPSNARLVLVGEQPGDQEDRQGRPFVGPAGRMLDQALVEAGVDRTQVYVTNAVKHFYFEERGKRRLHKKPKGIHIAACQDWLKAELESLTPKVVVAMGATAALSLLGKDIKITASRGQFFPHPKAEAVMVTIHPSYLLRLRDDMQKAEQYHQFVEELRTAWQRAAE